MAEIHWLGDVDGAFRTAADWTGGRIPNRFDDAILDAPGATFVVAVRSDRTVKSVQLASNATLDVSSGTFTTTDGTGDGANAGTISVGGDAAMAFGGLMDNTGEVDISTTYRPAIVTLLSNTTLTGGGLVTSIGNGFDMNAAAGLGVLDLVNVDNTISGIGSIGGSDGSIDLVNQSKGVIEASGGPLLSFGSGGTSTLTNDGLMQSGAEALLSVDTAVIDGAGGTIIAEAGGTIYLNAGAVTGQTMVVKKDGLISLGAASMDRDTVRNNGQMELGGAILDGDLTIDGNGKIDMMGSIVGSGAQAPVVLTNAGNNFVGYGSLGGGDLSVVNQAGGTIGNGGYPMLTIDTGGNVIVNQGLIEAGLDSVPAIAMTIESSLANSGVIAAAEDATMVIDAAVTGVGQATIIGGGKLDFESSFDQNVNFTYQGRGGAGVLELAQSQAYTATIAGFSATGQSRLKLLDIGSGAQDSISYSGTQTGGVLTVTDGVHTAQLRLSGDYLGSRFTMYGREGHGVVVSATASNGAVATISSFVSAMAGLGGSAGEPVHLGVGGFVREAMLTGPRTVAA